MTSPDISTNKREQFSCYRENIKNILRIVSNLSDWYFESNTVNKSILRKLQSRFSSQDRVNGKDIEMAKVQRDVWYFLLLTAIQYDFTAYVWDTTDLWSLFLESQTLEWCEDIHENTVRIIREAEEAIQTLWERPPANEMIILTQTTVSEMIRKILSNS